MNATYKILMLSKATVDDDLLDQLDGIGSKYEGRKHMHPSKYLSRQSIVTCISYALDTNFVCGIFGNGATSLTKKLKIIVEKQGLFGRIALVTVSQNPNFADIRNGIIQQIQQKRIDNCILIMDGFWWELSDEDFRTIGIPSPSESFRIVLTSRTEDMSKKFRRHLIFHIDLLEDEEAWDLFTEQTGISSIDLDLLETARGIVEECDGYRIAILTIASALKDKPPDVWKDSLQRLQSLNKDDMSSDMKVFSWIHLSYDLLNDNEARLMFLICCLLPEDSNVPVEDLVVFGKGLKLFENVDSINQARDRVECIIHKLKNSFLLLDGDEDGFVKVHNMCRKFGLWISSEGKHPYVVSSENDMKEWPLKRTGYRNCRAISFMCETIRQHPVDFRCPNLHLLQLSYGADSARLPNGIFEGLKNLKVLWLSIPSLSQPLTVLEKLRALCVTERKLDNRYRKLRPRIGDLLDHEMKDLEIFSFSTARPYPDFPAEIGLLHSLRFLRFNGKRLKYIPPGVLSNLVKLEELYLPLDFIGWGCKEEGGERINASLSEIESLHLTAIAISIPKGSNLMENLVNKLTRFRVFIGSHVSPDYEFGTSGNSKKVLEVFDIDADDFTVSWIDDLVWKSESLRLKQVRNLKNIVTWQPKEDQNMEFPQWKKICVSDCQELEYLVVGRIPWTSFSQLKSLKLFGLCNLKEIWNRNYLSKIEGPCFDNLGEIEIMFCRNLKHVFPISVAGELRQLQSLKICFCEEMESIFCRQQINNDDIFIQVATRSKEDEQDVGKDAIIIFPQLKTMELAYMDKLRIFYDTNYSILMPSLQSLSIFRCNHLEAFSYGLLETPSLPQIRINGNRYIITEDLNEEFKQLKDRSS